MVWPGQFPIVRKKAVFCAGSIPWALALEIASGTTILLETLSDAGARQFRRSPKYGLRGTFSEFEETVPLNSCPDEGSMKAISQAEALPEGSRTERLPMEANTVPGGNVLHASAAA